MNGQSPRLAVSTPMPVVAESLPEHRDELLTADTEADAELRKAVAVIEQALALSWLTQSQCRLLAVFRQQVGDYHAQNDPLLFGYAEWIKAKVERWCAEHNDAIRRKQSTIAPRGSGDRE